MHSRDGKKKQKSPERPNTAPASYGVSEDPFSYQNSLDSSSNSGDSESSLGMNNSNRSKSDVSFVYSSIVLYRGFCCCHGHSLISLFVLWALVRNSSHHCELLEGHLCSRLFFRYLQFN